MESCGIPLTPLHSENMGDSPHGAEVLVVTVEP